MSPAPLRKEKPDRRRRQVRDGAAAPELPPTRARQGVMLGHVRYVLGISLALVIVAFAIIYLIYF